MAAVLDFLRALSTVHSCEYLVKDVHYQDRTTLARATWILPRLVDLVDFPWGVTCAHCARTEKKSSSEKMYYPILSLNFSGVTVRGTKFCPELGWHSGAT